MVPKSADSILMNAFMVYRVFERNEGLVKGVLIFLLFAAAVQALPQTPSPQPSPFLCNEAEMASIAANAAAAAAATNGVRGRGAPAPYRGLYCASIEGVVMRA